MRLRKKEMKWHGAFDRLESRQLLTLALAAIDITATQQSSFNGAVATFVDTNLSATPSDFNTPPGSVEINWGDGSPLTVGTVVGAGLPGTFVVDGAHTYTQAGSFPTQVTVTDQNSQSASGVGSAVVTPQTTPSQPTTAAPALTIGANAIAGTAGQPLATKTTVATFLDPTSTDSSGDFNALITWGDGQISAGSVQGANGVFTVTGSNIYATAGTYTTTVMVVGVGTAPSATATGVASISNPIAATFSFSGMLATVGNGQNYSTGYTNTNQPMFTGTALPFSTVGLYARPHGIDTSLPLGETVANASGQWTLTTGPLAPLTYTVTATVTPAGGFPSNMMVLTSNNGVVHVAMAPKHVQSSLHNTRIAQHSVRRDSLRRQALKVHYSEAHRVANVL
jgi:large repetitive protein